MRLKTVTAPTMGEAMAAVRRELGEDAIIVSTETSLRSVKIVAAVEETGPLPDQARIDLASTARPQDGRDPVDQVHEALELAGVPGRLAERLTDTAFLSGRDDPLEALAASLGAVLQFQPFGPAGPVQPIMLVGTPGAGKTMAAAKLAARAVLEGRPTRLVTCDIVRAGAIEQLAAFARILKVPLATAERAPDLARAVAAAPARELVIVDTAGVNPYEDREMTELATLLRAVPAEPVLVLAAGGDPIDTDEQARLFSTLGIARILATRLDTTKRLGGVIAAAAGHDLALSDCSISQSVSEGLVPLDADSLARRLMPGCAAAPQARARGPRS